MKKLFLITTMCMILMSDAFAQISNAKTEIVDISGNCSMCEPAIEKAGTKKKLYTTDWNVDTKLATITYNRKETDLDAVLKSIAIGGYDNIKYLAPENAYNRLPDCCKYERTLKSKSVVNVTKQVVHPSEDHSMHANTNARDTANTQINPLKAVFDNYFHIKDALVKSDGEIASTKAIALLESINSVKMGSLKKDEHTVWMKIRNDLKADVQHIKDNKDPEHQREHFIELSANIYELVKASKPVEVIYYQNCPMANEGKGANWLSRESVIKNPYYGSQMLSCGKTIEIIKQ